MCGPGWRRCLATASPDHSTRTPAEFAKDHLPAALNLPVLDNAQRTVAGTLYKQRSAGLLAMRDYAWLGEEPARLQADLTRLKGLHSNETLARWQDRAAAILAAEAPRA